MYARKRFLLAAVLIASAGAAQAQEKYPTRPIKLVVAVIAGGPMDVMLLTTQLRPNAMAASRMALPNVVPATVVSPAPMPSLAPVAMTNVTIGPGVTTRTTVMRKKAANSSQFMIPTAIGYPPFSSPSSLIRSTETTRSPSAVSNTITPWVERPAMRIPSTRVRMSWPPSVTSMS